VANQKLKYQRRIHHNFVSLRFLLFNLGLQMNDPALHGDRHSFRAIGDAKLSEDIIKMIFHG
jgi:hypothetical protein